MATNIAEKAVERLFPAVCSVAPKADEVAPACRFWVVPGRHGPRWILPQNPRHGWPALRQWRPYDFLSRQKWTLLTAAYRAGRLGNLPGVTALGVAGADDTDWGHLGWSGAEPPAPVVYIGTPGPTRKAVAVLVAPDACAPASIAKAPLEPEAAALILREARNLERLAAEKPGVAPRLLSVDAEHGIAVQTPVSGRATSMALSGAHVDWLTRLQCGDAETSFRDKAETLAHRIAAIDDLDDSRRSRLEALLESISRPARFPATWAHGDFAPWNLRWAAPGVLAAFDWEFAEPGEIPGLDVAHFVCRTVMTRGPGGTDPRTLERKVLAALSSKAVRPLVADDRVYDLWKYYVIWYQVLLLEHKISDSYGTIFDRLCDIWTHGSHSVTAIPG